MVLDDKYLVNNVEQEVIDKFETEAENEVNALGVTDSFLIDKMVRCRIYMSLASILYESEESKAKYELYEKDFNRYMKMSQGVSTTPTKQVKSIKLFRG